MNRLLILLLLVLLLAACQGGGGDNNSSDTANANAQDSLVSWERGASNVVFRAEITGGEDADAFYRLNDVPLCTVYGDNRVVWSIQQEAATQVLFDVLEDRTIQGFMENLAFEEDIFSEDAGADLEVPSDSEPVVEQITVSINDRTHVTDSFGDWDINFFEDILSRCQGLSETPTVFEPEAAWVAAQQVEYAPSAPSIRWDTEASGLDLTALAESGEPEWIEEDIIRILWNLIRTSTPDLQFTDESGNSYAVVVQVPNVTIDAPPAP